MSNKSDTVCCLGGEPSEEKVANSNFDACYSNSAYLNLHTTLLFGLGMFWQQGMGVAITFTFLYAAKLTDPTLVFLTYAQICAGMITLLTSVSCLQYFCQATGPVHRVGQLLEVRGTNT